MPTPPSYVEKIGNWNLILSAADPGGRVLRVSTAHELAAYSDHPSADRFVKVNSQDLEFFLPMEKRSIMPRPEDRHLYPADAVVERWWLAPSQMYRDVWRVGTRAVATDNARHKIFDIVSRWLDDNEDRVAPLLHAGRVWASYAEAKAERQAVLSLEDQLVQARKVHHEAVMKFSKLYHGAEEDAVAMHLLNGKFTEGVQID